MNSALFVYTNSGQTYIWAVCVLPLHSPGCTAPLCALCNPSKDKQRAAESRMLQQLSSPTSKADTSPSHLIFGSSSRRDPFQPTSQLQSDPSKPARATLSHTASVQFAPCLASRLHRRPSRWRQLLSAGGRPSTPPTMRPIAHRATSLLGSSTRRRIQRVQLRPPRVAVPQPLPAL